MNTMSTNLRQKLRELNKQKEEFDVDNQNIDMHKNYSTTPVQLKKTSINQLILHPKSLNINNQDITLTPEEFHRREQEFNNDMQRECGQDAQWKKIQQNTFTRWANERLKLVNRHINNLQTDLSDGLNLIALIEILVNKKLPRYNQRPQFRSQKLENVSVVLDYLENIEKKRLVNIDALDIVDGNMKLILGLMWTLILHYSITLPAWEIPNEKRETIQNLKPKQKLMNWLQAKLPTQINIGNFTSDWNDGRAIGAVLNSCYPGLFPNWADRDPKNALENAKEAMDLAERWLGIPQLIQPHEMINPQVDEQSMMTYLSQYPNAQLQPGAPIKPKNYANQVHCYGSGLDRTGHIVDKPVIFHIETCAAGLGKVDVIVVNPNGQTEECLIEFREDINRTYDCVFYPTIDGEYKIIVTFNEQEVRNSPFLINVALPEPTPDLLVNDEVDAPGNEITPSDIEQPFYENFNPTNAIVYDRQETTDIKITNLDEEGDDLILEEDHIYYAHVMDNLEYIAETLPLQVENKHSHSSKNIQASPIQFEQSTNKITKDNSHIDSSVTFEHPLINQFYEYYNLEDVPRLQLFKQLNRRLTHIRQTLKTMSSNDIEIKLKYKRDALIKKRQTSIHSLTKDERIAMAELELNVYEYNNALNELSSKCFPLNKNDQLGNEQLLPIPPALLSCNTIVPVVKNPIISETSISPSVSTFHTVRPSAISQSTVLLSTTTQFSEKTEKILSWNHPLLSNLMNTFEPITPSCKTQIHKQLARRYEHICKKAKELSKTQLQTPLEQSKKILQPNKDERLRIAELELCLFELEKGK
ncbi:unnamed protein product [Rotaria sp. Silwood2]|nr:unnamed protein product [Rotaria sp. Silwood2]